MLGFIEGKYSLMAKKYLHLGKILKKLLFDKGMKPIDLAREVNIPASTIHRLITGKSTRPYKSSLKPIADFFSVSVEQLTDEKFFTETKIESSDGTVMKIFIYEWQSLESNNLIKTNKTILTTNKISKKSFALIMPDTSMEPLFPRNSVLIFDPDTKPQDRSYILVKIHKSNSCVFRQLLINVNHKYLKPLNPDLRSFKMKLLETKDTFLGCLVESRQNFNVLDQMEETI